MFKMLHPLFFVIPVAWLTVLILTGVNLTTPFLEELGLTPRLGWTVLGVQALVALFFATPLWRFFWWLIPPLKRRVYPDLNGLWDVELDTNWPRIDALLKAANHEAAAIDMRIGDETILPPLGKMMLRARIRQSWIAMKVELWNPKDEGPIRESQTISVDPFRGKDGRHGLSYFFEQENATDVVSDDIEFMGAARLVQSRDNSNVLCGRMWNDRMWRRGMNTAADVRFTRRTFPRSVLGRSRRTKS